MTTPDNSTATLTDDQPPLLNPAGVGEGSSGNEPDDDNGTPTDPNELVRQIASERRIRKAAQKQATELQKQLDELAKRVKGFEDRDKTNEQRATEALTAAQAETTEAAARADKAELDLLRHQVGLRKGLAYNQLHRLTGTTREELEEDADRYLEELASREDDGKPRKPAPDTRLGRGEGGKPSTAEQFAAALSPLI